MLTLVVATALALGRGLAVLVRAAAMWPARRHAFLNLRTYVDEEREAQAARRGLHFALSH